MSGQRPQHFDPTPTRYADVGVTANPTRTQTAQYTPTQAQYTNNGQGLAAIGSALGTFFGGLQRSLETVQESNRQEELVQIDRENEALRKQAVVDQKLGKPMDPAYTDRQDYAGTYQTSAADAAAFDLAQGLRKHMAQQPLDGSVDLAQTAQDYYKAQVGTGTGNRDYDARMLSQFSRAAEEQVAQFNEAQQATVLQNTTQEVVHQFTQHVFSPGGITTPQFAEWRERIGTLVRGDNVKRDQLIMAAVSAAVQNDGQGMSVLRAMQDLGMDKSEPDYFNRISEEVLKRTNAVKTFDAGLAVQNYRMDFALEKSRYPQGILPPERIAEFAARAHQIDTVHGVGLEPFGLEQEWSKGTRKAAGVNLWKASLRGEYGTQDSMRVASSFGASPASVLAEHYDSGLSEIVSQLSPALAASRDKIGLVSPMKSDEAAQDYAKFILAGGPNAGHRAASQDTISDTYKSEMGNPLIGRDPVRMERSFGFYNALSQGGMTKDQLHRYFPNEQAENTFWAMQIMSNGDRGIKQIAKDLVERPYDAKDIEQVARTGHIDLAAVARRGGVTGRPEEIDRQIVEARNNAILDSADRKKWFGSAAIALDSNESAKFDALLLDQFQLHKRTRGSINLEDSIKAVAGQTGKFIVVPGFDGALQAIRDPFEGRGRTMLHPLNEDPAHPLSLAKGYAPIYAPGQRMVNAMGHDEDLVVTWAEDAAALHKSLPGKVPEHDALYLERPNKAGLSQVRNGSGSAIQFMPGERLGLRTGPDSVSSRTLLDGATVVGAVGLVGAAVAGVAVPPAALAVAGLMGIAGAGDLSKPQVPSGLTEVTIPQDPKAAAEFFRANLGPGWYVQRDGYMGPNGQAYTLYYGARLKTGEKERDLEISKRGRFISGLRDGSMGRADGITELPGGAAILFPHSPRKK